MLASSINADAEPKPGFDIRLVIAVLLLAAAGFCTWTTIQRLSTRRIVRAELAEISHARYELLNPNRWVEILLPILEARIDALDFKASDQAGLRPMVENALYRLLDDLKANSTPKSPPAPGGGAGPAPLNPLMVNLMVGALRPHVPEYANAFLAELRKPDTKDALKKYIKNALVAGAKDTFGNLDSRYYAYILKEHGCTEAHACQELLDRQIREADSRTSYYAIAVLVSAALAFLLLMAGRPAFRRTAVAVLLLFCVVLLVGGVLTPMIEVEAKISQLNFTFLGERVAFTNQVLYFQSKSVLEVFRALITDGRPDMWFVGVLVLMFSVIFPILKIFTTAFCLFRPAVLRRNRLARFLALESSKWSMADVMALAIFMAFVAFNGLIGTSMAGLRQIGADLVIPTNSSKLLPGYLLFIGFCMASLLLSKKLEKTLRASDG